MNPSISQIKRHTARLFNVSLEGLNGRSQARRLAHARFAAFKLSREMTRRSLPVIGRSFDRHHTSILTGVRRANSLMADPKYAARVEIARWSIGYLEQFKW